MTWLMKFNQNKCCVMTMAKYKILHDCILHDTPLPVVNQLKYLAWIILQMGQTCVSAVVSKARQTLGSLKRNFKTAPQTIRGLAYTQVECTASSWSPWLLQDITRLEGLQIM